MPAVGRTPSDRGYLSIKEVLDVLVEEFPDITISKIRFLESRGLIHPERTPSGYRKFFEVDVDRLRWILRQQREHFLPLKVIKGRLDRDTGGTVEASLFDGDLDGDDREQPATTPPSPVATRPDDETAEAPLVTAPTLPKMPQREPVSEHPADDAPRTLAVAQNESTTDARAVATAPVAAVGTARPEPSYASGVGLSASELCGASGAAPGLIEALEEFGLIAAVVVGSVRSYNDDALVVARLAATFAQVGVEPRHLAVLKRAADRQAELYAQAVAPLLRQRNPAARTQAQERLDRLVEVGSALQSSFVKAALQRQIGQ
jgi:DNA-binding transcriptional MerR regulator